MSTSKDPASLIWLNRKELAQHLNLSLRKIDYMVSDGEIPHVNIGRSIRFHRPSIDELLLSKMERRVNGKD